MTSTVLKKENGNDVTDGKQHRYSNQCCDESWVPFVDSVSCWLNLLVLHAASRGFLRVFQFLLLLKHQLSICCDSYAMHGHSKMTQMII